MTAYDRTTLPNGVRVITAPMDSVQSTACYLMFEAGSRYERAEDQGLAHFVEHVIFCGTPRRPTPKAIAGEVDAIGGLFNASTGKEGTYYYVKCASEYAPQALDVLTDMIRNSLFNQEDVDREKDVIIEEMRSKYNNPSDYVDENFELLLYGDTPLGRIRIGTEETVGGMTRDRIADFAGRMYEPSRLIVGLAGRVDDALLGRVEELLGDLAGTRAPDFEPARANGSATVLLDSKPIDQAHLCMGVRAYPESHPDRPAVQLLGTVLGAGMSSRLYEELTIRRGLAYSVFMMLFNHSDTGALWAEGGVNVEKVDEAITVIADELRRTTEEPIPSDELEKARTYAKSRFVFSTETPQDLLTRALWDEVKVGRVREPEEQLQALNAVTAEDIQRVAADIVGGGLYLSIIGPYDDPARFEKLLIA
jgi:predicted Zn-dependent peptidase